VKAIQRNASAAAEADSYRPELIADDEPRYLRRQKPVEIRRKKFSGRGGRSIGGSDFELCRRCWCDRAVYGMQFLLYSPAMLLHETGSDRIERGNRIVSREAVLQQFVHDATGVFCASLWTPAGVNWNRFPGSNPPACSASCPNRLRIELTERTPLLLLRNGNELALIDAHGVILDRPRGEDLHFPIVNRRFGRSAARPAGKAHADVRGIHEGRRARARRLLRSR